MAAGEAMRAVTTTAVAIGVGLVIGWVLREPTEPVPERVVRTVRRAVRVDVPGDCADPVTPACADEERVALALLGFPDDVPLAPPETETECRARIALATALGTARQLDQVGRPEPFPPDLPDAYREAAITAVAEQVVETCPELGLDLRKVDCSEFPCLALFVHPADREGPASCPAWREAYGDAQTTSNGTLVGPDGAELVYELMGPAPPPKFLIRELAQQSDDEPFVQSNGMKRLMQRGRTAQDEIIAELGARERTEAEKHDQLRRFWQMQVDEDNPFAAQMLEALDEQWASETDR